MNTPLSQRNQIYLTVLVLVVMFSGSIGAAYLASHKIDQSDFANVWLGFVLGGAAGLALFILLAIMFWRQALAVFKKPVVTLFSANLMLCAVVASSIVIPGNARFEVRFESLLTLQSTEIRELRIYKPHGSEIIQTIQADDVIQDFVASVPNAQRGGNPKRLLTLDSGGPVMCDVKIILNDNEPLRIHFIYRSDSTAVVSGSFIDSLVFGDFECTDGSLHTWLLNHVDRD